MSIGSGFGLEKLEERVVELLEALEVACGVIGGSRFPDLVEDADPTAGQFAECGVMSHVLRALPGVVGLAPRAPFAGLIGE